MMGRTDSTASADRIDIDGLPSDYIAPIPSDVLERIGRDGCIVGRRVA